MTSMRVIVLMCFILLMASINAHLDYQIHLLKPRTGSAGHPMSGVNCNSWRLAVETDNIQNWNTVPDQCEGYVGHYMLGGQYWKDCSLVAATAIAYASSVKLNNDGKDIWVFDIDETSLSNLPYYARPANGFGALPFNATSFDLWQTEARAPAIPSVLKLYERVLQLGIKVVFLTGTSEKYKEPKERNMRNVGYHTWELMILKNASEARLTSLEYKSMHRTELEKKGYRIVGNIGDQWSDVLGPHPGLRTFKLPDPMYYIS